MSALTSKSVLRPRAGGPRKWAEQRFMTALPYFFSLLRCVKPVWNVAGMTLTSRYDHVREVFATEAKFGVMYKQKLDIIMGGEPFFLGTDDRSQHHDDTAALCKVILPSDLQRLASDVEERATRIINTNKGQIEIVNDLTRQVSFDFLATYLGIPSPANGDLRVWATRLFEFLFADGGNDLALRAEVDEIAPALRAHIDAIITLRKQNKGDDDVLARCLTLQSAHEPGFSDVQIRTALMGMMVGGPPQPPMVLPQAMEQLLQRPQILAEAQAAARNNDDETLRRYVLEAMRFDPLGPGLWRVALTDVTLARGTRHEVTIKAGSHVLAAFASAMMDSRRISNPKAFNPHRPAADYMHFGYGLHACFGRYINLATLHLMLKPLLKQPGLRRAPGADGKLSKNGPFAERLVVRYDFD
ncbi:cytochrome P450 [Citrobacter arsenatis]|uniref:cytochrome P450 n=1 Tax=Citrobacter arsenatis TaxID=2546350 RepID=UPI003D7FAAFF